MLHIYRASAGAGKTHTLVLYYIKLVLQKPVDFKKILAITFTNKATDEMKNRILSTLFNLSQGKEKNIANQLTKTTGLKTYAEIQKQAKKVLNYILHQYDDFSICTVDSFFQKIIHAFIYELGLEIHTLSLNLTPALQYMEEKFFSQLKKSNLSAMLSFAQNKLLQGKSWDIKKNILALGKEIFSPQYLKQEQNILQDLKNPKNSEQFTTILYHIIQHVENQKQYFSQYFIHTMQTQQLQVQDFAYGKNGVAGYFEKLSQKQYTIPPPTQRIIQALNDKNFWYSKNAEKKEKIIAIHKKLQQCLQQWLDFYQKYAQYYHTAQTIQNYIYIFSIIKKLQDYLKDYRKKHKVIFITDTINILKKIIDKNDTPYIYEKIGNHYQHFLIDEFQDISSMQWKNLLPLVQNALAEGYQSMLVGDPKQAIYRWRGGDWHLLQKKILEDFNPKQVQVNHLNYNFRSSKTIVDFNNQFFFQAAKILKTVLNEDIQNLTQTDIVENIYKTVEQTKVKNKKGLFSIQIITKENINKTIISLIEKLQNHNIALKNIAILVRNHKEAQHILNLCNDKQNNNVNKTYQYHAIASTSLQLKKSVFINIIIAAINYLQNEKNTIAKATLVSLYQQYILNHHFSFESISDNFLPKAFITQKNQLSSYPIFDCVENIIQIFQLSNQHSLPYLVALQESIQQWSNQQNTTNQEMFLQWWEDIGQNTSLPFTENQEAIQILTIHQAKGLQFHTVIIPFCDWNLDHMPQKSPILWCKNTQKPFNYLHSLPIPYSKSLQNTYYAQAYAEEKCNIYIDHFNLLYVAFTRAKNRCYVMLPQKKSSTAKKITTIDELILNTLSVKSSDICWNKYWDKKNTYFFMGKEIPENKKDNIKTSEHKITLKKYYTANNIMFYNSKKTKNI